MKSYRDKGSVLLSALIFGTVILILIASVLKYSMSEYTTTRRSLARDISFHLAEAGIERAIYALQYGEIIGSLGSDWRRTGYYSWELEMNDVSVGRTLGEISIDIFQLSDDRFMITSLGTTDYGPGEVDRAIKVTVDLIEDPNKPNNHYRPDFVFKDKIVLGEHNGGPSQVASWDSGDSVDPIFTPSSQSNTGFNCIVASLSDSIDAIELDNVWIDGSLGVAGDIPSQFNRTNNSNQGAMRARLKGPDTPQGLLWDVDRVIDHFSVDIPVPEYPDPDDFDIVVSYDQNTWNSGAPIVIGELRKSTYAIAQNSFNLNHTHITIQGDVVLYVDGAINTNGLNTIHFNGEESSLIIVAEETINFSGELSIESRFPKQLLILQPKNYGDIIIHTKRFSGFIYAPESDIRLHGTNPPRGIRKNYYLGGIVGKSLDHTNGFTLVSDSSMRNQNSKTDPTVQSHIVVLNDWNEVSPSSLNSN